MDANEYSPTMSPEEFNSYFEQVTKEMEALRYSDPARFLALVRAINESFDDIKKSHAV